MFKKMWNFFKKLFYLRKSKAFQREFFSNLESIYETQKLTYYYNCRELMYKLKYSSKENNRKQNEEIILSFEVYFSMRELELLRKFKLNIDELIKQFENMKQEKFTIFKEYGFAQYEQIMKNIKVGDRVLRYRMYSQIYKKNFRTAEREKFEYNQGVRQAINFYDYYKP